jgi:transposase
MARGTVNVDEQRIRFVASAKRGEKSMSTWCEEFAISRPTGYQWLRRYAADGIAGVVEKSRRPHWSARRWGASSVARRISCGRWISRARWDGMRRWVRCRGWTITAARRSRCTEPGAPKQRP